MYPNKFSAFSALINYTGTFALNNQYMVGKSLKAMHVLVSNIFKHNVNPKVSLQLFDAFVNPILNYGSQTWGFTKSKELERIHLKFCKTILGVKQSTCNAAVYGELGRYPVFINRHIMIIKYWIKLLQTKNILLKTMYDVMLKDLILGKINWLSKVKQLLQQNGFLYIWELS